MRPLFRPDGCAINEQGISRAGNPLARALDAVTNDPMAAQQIREGYLGGPRPMGPLGPGSAMLDPMMRRGTMEEVWAQEHGGPRPPMAGGVPLGATMQEQLRRHMDGPMGVELGGEAGFFDVPMQMPARPMGPDWAQEFAGSGPAGPSQGQFMPPPRGMRPLGADWAEQFALPPMPPGAAEMDAAFREARMGPRPQQPMALQHTGPAAQLDPGPVGQMVMGPMQMGPMPMMGPMAPMMPMQRPVVPPPVADMGVAVQHTQPPPEAQQEAPAVADQTAADQADLGQAAQMVEMLRNSGNPKFANSQFVNFIDKVSKGDLQFRENTVTDRDGNQVDWDALYDTDAATATDAEREELENLWAASGGQGEMASLEKAWDDSVLEDAWKMAQGDANLDKLWDQESMEEMFRLARDGMGDGDAAALEHTFKDLNMEELLDRNSAQKNRDYEFSKDNQYVDSDDPLAEAQRLLREGRDREALLALEAEVQRNPESSEGWRQLGQLYADLDQDVEAIQCLRKGHEVDPYNLDSLLALGVSCTNELDQLPALRYLREWIENHEEHQVLVHGLERPPEYEYESWRNQVTLLFNQAAQANPLDANVFVALGVMENINRNYEAAVAALATACRLRPNDHTCWNKLGATLANSGKSAQAVISYHQGLQLKPNYARSWSNLAIAHANLGEHSDAARFYLSSLVLNPEATHIWNFLHSAVLNMNSLNATDFQAIDNRDLDACTKLIEGVLDPASLPRPAQELPQSPDEILASMGL